MTMKAMARRGTACFWNGSHYIEGMKEDFVAWMTKGLRLGTKQPFEVIRCQPGTWARVRKLVRELRKCDPSSMWPGALEALEKLEGRI